MADSGLPAKATGEAEPTLTCPRSSLRKGVWMPSLLGRGAPQSMADAADLRGLCVGWVPLVVGLPVDEDGIPQERFDPEEIRTQAEAYQAAGLAVGLAISFDYYADVNDLHTRQSPPYPESVRAGLRETAAGPVAHLAQLAEDLGLDFFAPANEPDLQWGVEQAAPQMQELGRVAREHFSGDLVYKAHETAGLDFSGYDIVGISLSPLDAESVEDYAARVEDRVGNLVAHAEVIGGAEGAMISEFGLWGDLPAWEADASRAAAYTIVLEAAARANLGGVMVLDGPDVGDGTSLPLGESPGLDVVRAWYAAH